MSDSCLNPCKSCACAGRDNRPENACDDEGVYEGNGECESEVEDVCVLGFRVGSLVSLVLGFRVSSLVRLVLGFRVSSLVRLVLVLG